MSYRCELTTSLGSYVLAPAFNKLLSCFDEVSDNHLSTCKPTFYVLPLSSILNFTLLKYVVPKGRSPSLEIINNAISVDNITDIIFSLLSQFIFSQIDVTHLHLKFQYV